MDEKFKNQSRRKGRGLEVAATRLRNGRLSSRSIALQLNDDFFLYKKIESVLADLMITIEERDRSLPNERDSAQRKLHGQRLLVNRLQKSWPKLRMNGNRGAQSPLA